MSSGKSTEISSPTSGLMRSVKFWYVFLQTGTASVHIFTELHRSESTLAVPVPRKTDLYTFFLNLWLQSQSQGSITLKIIPAIKEEDKHKESTVNDISHYDPPAAFLQYTRYSSFKMIF